MFQAIFEAEGVEAFFSYLSTRAGTYERFHTMAVLGDPTETFVWPVARGNDGTWAVALYLSIGEAELSDRWQGSTRVSYWYA